MFTVTTLPVDTHRVIESLKLKGFTDSQAEGVTEVIRDLDLDHLVTKADLNDAIGGLNQSMSALEVRLIKWATTILLGQIAVFAIIVKWLVG